MYNNRYLGLFVFAKDLIEVVAALSQHVVATQAIEVDMASYHSKSLGAVTAAQIEASTDCDIVNIINCSIGNRQDYAANSMYDINICDTMSAPTSDMLFINIEDSKTLTTTDAQETSISNVLGMLVATLYEQVESSYNAISVFYKGVEILHYCSMNDEDQMITITVREI